MSLYVNITEARFVLVVTSDVIETKLVTANEVKVVLITVLNLDDTMKMSSWFSSLSSQQIEKSIEEGWLLSTLSMRCWKKAWSLWKSQGLPVM